VGNGSTLGARRSRFRELMAARELDVAIATTPENVQYLSGFTTGRAIRLNYEIQTYAIVSALDDQVTLVIPASQLGLVAQTRPDIGGVETYGQFYLEVGSDPVGAPPDLMSVLAAAHPHVSAGEALLCALRSRKFSDSRIGVDEMGIAPAIAQELGVALPRASLQSVHDDLFRYARATKDSDECESLQRAAAIAEAALESTWAEIQDGDSHALLVRRFAQCVIEHGGVPELINLRLGPEGAMPDVLPQAAVVVGKGSLVTWDVVVGLAGYHADTARCAVFGEPTPKQRIYYEASLAGQQAALSLLKPGVAARDVFGAATEAVRTNGIPHYRRHHVGHGIGLAVYEFPSVTPGSSDVLEAGNVVNIETPYYELGFGNVMVEDTVRITRDGFEALTSSDRAFRVLG
jgi:Xaa-Pro dipeptidase